MIVKHIIYIRVSDQEIERIELAQGTNPQEGLDAEGVYHIVYYYEAISNPIEFMELNYYSLEHGSFVDRSPKPNPFSYWAGNGWTWNDTAFLEYIRKDRDSRLYATDWTQVADAPLTSAEIAEAIAYRQALRDVTTPLISNPENYPTLESVPWPTKPSFIA